MQSLLQLLKIFRFAEQVTENNPKIHRPAIFNRNLNCGIKIINRSKFCCADGEFFSILTNKFNQKPHKQIAQTVQRTISPKFTQLRSKFFLRLQRDKKISKKIFEFFRNFAKFSTIFPVPKKSSISTQLRLPLQESWNRCDHYENLLMQNLFCSFTPYIRLSNFPS